jgi:hypothetical protein
VSLNVPAAWGGSLSNIAQSQSGPQRYDPPMAFKKTQYLHLYAYPCEKCKGPVIAASLGIRETELTKEIDIRHLDAICLFCGNRQSVRTTPVRDFFPAQWDLTFRGIQEGDSDS